MSFDWSEYLVLAKELASQTQGSSTQEARWRSAVSRAYYAAFRKARNHLRDKEGKRQELASGNTHQIVINLFSELYNNSRNKNPKHLLIAQNLRDLRSARNRTDYEDVVTNLQGLASTSLIKAEKVISSLSTL